MNSKTEICALALSRLGNQNSIEDIDNPKKQTEVVCAKWYDVSRQSALKTMMPNFARKRAIWALDANYTPAFGYEHAYKYQSDCLKILGVGDVRSSKKNYEVEGGYLLTNVLYEDGLPVRYVADITDVSKFTPDFIQLFSWFMARNICMELEVDMNKYQAIEQILPSKIVEYCGVDSQENPPHRVSRSLLEVERLGLYPFNRSE
jgi:hypothetical protein